MKALIVYDSVYGNTEKIARTMGEAISGEVKVLRASEVSSSELESLDILIVGSPTQAGRPIPGMKEFLNKISNTTIKRVSVAAFDTRVPSKFARVFGYAGGRIAKSLKEKSGNAMVPPEGFIVTGGKDPLKDGELERAAAWAKEVVESK